MDLVFVWTIITKILCTLWLIHNGTLFSHSFGGWKSAIRVPPCLGEGPLTTYRLFLVSLPGRRVKLAPGAFFKGTNPIHEDSANHLSETSLPNTITLGSRFSTYRFAGEPKYAGHNRWIDEWMDEYLTLRARMQIGPCMTIKVACQILSQSV